jgi:hypothetical protein
VPRDIWSMAIARHTSPATVMVYQHSSIERSQQIAARLPSQ